MRLCYIKYLAAICTIAILLNARSVSAADSGIVIRTQPEKVYLERNGQSQYFVFAFSLSNNSDQAVKLVELRMMAYDARSTLLNSSKVDSNGGRPSIEVLSPRQLDAHKTLTVFNPFDQLSTSWRVATLRYEFDFAGEKERTTIPIEIKPLEYIQKTSLACPVPGRVWAYEAPGFYSHHSRIDLNDEFTRDVMKMSSNSQRFAVDLVVVDEKVHRPTATIISRTIGSDTARRSSPPAPALSLRRKTGSLTKWTSMNPSFPTPRCLLGITCD